MDILANISKLVAVIFILTAIIKNIPNLQKIDARLIALAVAVVLTPLAMYTGYLPHDFNAAIEMITALFGANIANDKLADPITSVVSKGSK